MLVKFVKMTLLWGRAIHMMLYDKQELIRMVQRVMDCEEDEDTIDQLLEILTELWKRFQILSGSRCNRFPMQICPL